MLKSFDELAIISPELSIETERNCVNLGDVIIRKLIYFFKSYARTVPSNEDVIKRLLLLFENVMSVILLLFSEKVFKQTLREISNIFRIFFEFAAMKFPSGEKLMFSMYEKNPV